MYKINRGIYAHNENKIFDKSLKEIFYNLSLIYLILKLQERLQSFVILIIFCHCVQELKPKVSKETIKSPAQRRAIAKIREGEMIPANQSETIDDAISNWGAVQKVERKLPLKKKRQKVKRRK
ncbi:Uncharacterized protein BM_BM1122 [Brugia malayi]|uniref:Uncharacterized protein n=1 Tax=Brugia malayi TaxID=6279 RepID=A0A4E9FTE6_BRUMA|nr:Uncharacterized protein BM_BM1122 [Brugia malayi]VIP00042.1 Uncharacterized protein BM_BM1122 [Brugia malayi]